MIISNIKVGESLVDVNKTCESRNEPLLVQDGEGTTMVIMPVDMYDEIMLIKKLYKNAFEDERSGVTYTVGEVAESLNKEFGFNINI